MEAQSKTRTLLPFGEALANSLAVTCLDVHPEEELLVVFISLYNALTAPPHFCLLFGLRSLSVLTCD